MVTSAGELALRWSSGGRPDATSCSDVGMTSRSRQLAVSGIPRTAFCPWWFWRRGLRSRREANAWQGYGSNTTHPPNANFQWIGTSDIATSRQIYGTGSDSRREFRAVGFGMRGPRAIFKCFNNALGFKNLGYMGFYVICLWLLV